jgi:uncharacterized membrane protein
MNKARMEAFSDGVVAIIITIMVIEMKVPEGATFEALWSVAPVFFSYILSFIYIGIYWNNHHHLLTAGSRINGAIMWANLHHLFWLSLVPFVTGWMGENEFAPIPTAVYGAVLLMASMAYLLLQHQILQSGEKTTTLRRIIGMDLKGKLSVVLYIIGIAVAFISPFIACAIYLAVAVVWIIPDRRIEKALEEPQ